MNIYSLHTILLCVFDLYLILYTGGEWPASLNLVYNIIVEKSLSPVQQRRCPTGLLPWHCCPDCRGQSQPQAAIRSTGNTHNKREGHRLKSI